MKLFICLIIIFLSFFASAQKFLNLDFEHTWENSLVPSHWITNSVYYHIDLDTTFAYSGNNSLKMESKNITGTLQLRGMCYNRIPSKLLKGKTLEVTAQIRTSDVSDGAAGIWMRMEGDGKPVVVHSLDEKELSGTKDWHLVSIDSKIPPHTKTIYFGAIHNGKGTAWFDNFTISTGQMVYEEKQPDYYIPDDDDLVWLKDNLIPIQTSHPDSSHFKYAAELKSVLGQAKVVALGEVSHGSKEIADLKHRLTRFLVENCGFSHFAFEANMPEAKQINN